MTNDTEAPASCCSTTAVNPAAAGNGRANLLAAVRVTI